MEILQRIADRAVGCSCYECRDAMQVQVHDQRWSLLSSPPVVQDLLHGQAAPRRFSWAGMRQFFRGRSAPGSWMRLPGSEDVHD